MNRRQYKKRCKKILNCVSAYHQTLKKECIAAIHRAARKRKDKARRRKYATLIRRKEKQTIQTARKVWGQIIYSDEGN